MLKILTRMVCFGTDLDTFVPPKYGSGSKKLILSTLESYSFGV